MFSPDYAAIERCDSALGAEHFLEVFDHPYQRYGYLASAKMVTAISHHRHFGQVLGPWFRWSSDFLGPAMFEALAPDISLLGRTALLLGDSQLTDSELTELAGDPLFDDEAMLDVVAGLLDVADLRSSSSVSAADVHRVLAAARAL